MPRKTRRNGLPGPRAAGFNEAAARCHGKHDGITRKVIRQDASMRPRPDATENGHRRRHRDLGLGASMRPRPDATENSRTC